MAKRIRTFIAVEISPAVREQLVKLQDRLRSSVESVKWVEPENLHLTLKFLGEVDEQELYAVCKGVQREVEGAGPFEMTIAGVGAFPSLRRPRVIWAGVTDGAREVSHVHAVLDKYFRAQGYPHEDRRYTPHLTLGRFRDPRVSAEFSRIMAELAEYDAGTCSVHEVLVMASQLSSAGPQYTVMGRASLTGPGD